MQTRFKQAIAIRKQMWPDVAFSRESNAFLLAKLLEEAGEVAGATTSYFGRTYRPDVEPGNVANVKAEIGDAFFILLGLCDIWSIDPDDCLDLVIEKLTKRYQTSALAEVGWNAEENRFTWNPRDLPPVDPEDDFDINDIPRPKW